MNFNPSDLEQVPGTSNDNPGQLVARLLEQRTAVNSQVGHDHSYTVMEGNTLEIFSIV